MATPITPFDLTHKIHTSCTPEMIAYVNTRITTQWTPKCPYAMIRYKEFHDKFSDFKFEQVFDIQRRFINSGWRVDFVTLALNPFEYFLLFK